MKMLPFFVSQGQNDEKKPTTSSDIFLVVLLLLAACFTVHIGKESRQAGRQAGNPGFIKKRIENTCCPSL